MKNKTTFKTLVLGLLSFACLGELISKNTTNTQNTSSINRDNAVVTNNDDTSYRASANFFFDSYDDISGYIAYQVANNNIYLDEGENDNYTSVTVTNGVLKTTLDGSSDLPGTVEGETYTISEIESNTFSAINGVNLIGSFSLPNTSDLYIESEAFCDLPELNELIFHNKFKADENIVLNCNNLNEVYFNFEFDYFLDPSWTTDIANLFNNIDTEQTKFGFYFNNWTYCYEYYLHNEYLLNSNQNWAGVGAYFYYYYNGEQDEQYYVVENTTNYIQTESLVMILSILFGIGVPFVIILTCFICSFAKKKRYSKASF